MNTSMNKTTSRFSNTRYNKSLQSRNNIINQSVVLPQIIGKLRRNERNKAVYESQIQSESIKLKNGQTQQQSNVNFQSNTFVQQVDEDPSEDIVNQQNYSPKSRQFHDNPVQQRVKFFDNLRQNRFVIVPKGDLIQDASKLNMPYFSIIEVPIKKYLLVKKQQEKQSYNSQVKNVRNSSQQTTQNQANNQGTIGLFRYINDEQFKHMKKKVNQSESIKVMKFKYKNSDSPGPDGESSILSQQYLLQGQNELNKVEEDRVKIKSKLMSGFQQQDQSQQNSSSSMQLSNSQLKTSFNKSSQQDTLSLAEKIKQQLNADLMTKLYDYEYEKLKQKIIEEKGIEHKLKQITDKVKWYAGAMSGKPQYRYEKFLDQMSRSPSLTKQQQLSKDLENNHSNYNN
eukprot:403340373